MPSPSDASCRSVSLDHRHRRRGLLGTKDPENGRRPVLLPPADSRRIPECRVCRPRVASFGDALKESCRDGEQRERHCCRSRSGDGAERGAAARRGEALGANRPPRLIDRPHIRSALDANPGATLTILDAPAGYGKTTADQDLVRGAGRGAYVGHARWRRQRPESPVAVHRDSRRSRVPRPCTPGVAASGGDGGPIELVVDELMTVLSRRKKPLILVLDDLHTVTDRDALASIDYALAQVPAHVRVMLSTRVDPPLSLARMRASQQLTELRASDLAFTVEEARALLVDRSGLDLSGAQIEALVDRTQGWPAALVLAAIWLRSVEDPSSAVSRFSGSQRFVADYLSTEVLAALDEDHRRFLQGIAVLGQFTPRLCDAALGRSDSGEMLVELEHADLFVAKLEDGDWYRIHPLFAEYAHVELEASEPGATIDDPSPRCVVAGQGPADRGDGSRVGSGRAGGRRRAARNAPSDARSQWGEPDDPALGGYVARRRLDQAPRDRLRGRGRDGALEPGHDATPPLPQDHRRSAEHSWRRRTRTSTRSP